MDEGFITDEDKIANVKFGGPMSGEVIAIEAGAIGMYCKQPKMTPAQYAEFMAKHAKAGQRTNKRRAFFRGSK